MTLRTFLNQRWLEYTGLSAEEALGWGWKVAVHPDDLPHVLMAFQDAVNLVRPFEVEGRFRRFDGEYRWFLIRGNPLRDQSGKIVKWYGTNTDLEDRKRAEDALRASEQNFRLMTAINLKSVWMCMKYELQQMRKQGSGAIVNNSSIGGLLGLPGRAIYHAAKHGVIGLTKSAALEYAARGITINAVCPGTIDTPMVAEMIAKDPSAMEDIMKMQPIGRLGKAEEVASAVLWLWSPGAAFVVGHALAVDGGFTAQ